MYCPDCHTHLPDDYAFCTSCGKNLKYRFTDEQETVLRASNIGPERPQAVGGDAPAKTQSHGKTADDGRMLVTKELAALGIDFVEHRGSRQYSINVRKADGRQIELRVKTKRNKGNWHSDTKFAKPVTEPITPENEGLFWIFVNLNDYKLSPAFWIVPDLWLQNDIWTAHQKYLDKRQGHRAKNDNSTHHSIDEKRLERWRDQWRLLL